MLEREQEVLLFFFFFFNDTATTEIYTLSLHDALPIFEVRAGVSAERAAYPLAFDPNTWLVVLYEDEEYVGYGFKLQH